MTGIALFIYFIIWGIVRSIISRQKKRLLTSSMTRTFFVAHVPPPRVLVHARLQVSAAVLARQTQPNCGVCVSGVKTYLNYTHTAGIQLCFRLDR